MKKDGLIEITNKQHGPYQQQVFKTVATVEVSEAARDAIRKALRFLRGRSAKNASDFTHEFSRAWKRALDGEEIDLYLDTLGEDDFVESQRSIDKARAALDDVFKRPS
jgi:hypothetical protein